MSEVLSNGVAEPWVLLVEDSEPDEVAFTFVARQSGWKGRLVVERTLEASLERLKAESSQPTMIVVDYRLAGSLPGIDLIRRIRTELRLASVRIVLLTGLCDEHIARQADEAGANDCLDKPVVFEEYRKLISNLFRSSD